MERVQSAQSPASQEAAVPSLAAVEPLEGAPSLEALARTARELPGSEGRAALQALHARLAALAPTEENGRALVQLLDRGQLQGLVADDGRLTRPLAVEALLGLGYPWALQIHPDELAWYRASISERARNRRLLILLSILGLELVALAALYLPY